jgi:hypothetical protein
VGSPQEVRICGLFLPPDKVPENAPAPAVDLKLLGAVPVPSRLRGWCVLPPAALLQLDFQLRALSSRPRGRALWPAWSCVCCRVKFVKAVAVVGRVAMMVDEAYAAQMCEQLLVVVAIENDRSTESYL